MRFAHFKSVVCEGGKKTNFIILDAGMTELIRPALYQSYHKIENLTADLFSTNLNANETKYDVVGPIYESSDFFAKSLLLPTSQRGHLFALRTSGAYGQVMSLEYNLRERHPPFIQIQFDNFMTIQILNS